MQKKPDRIFISYRRQTSKHPTLLVYKDLSQRGYDVFMDYQTLNSGKFAPQILNQIESRSHFIVILSPGCLDRTKNPDDWLRREIEHAIDTQRNIVPLLFDDFSFEQARQFLKGKLSALGDYNGLEVHDGYFDAAMKKLRNRFLMRRVRAVIKPAPRSDNTFVQNALGKVDVAVEEEKQANQDAFRKYFAAPSTAENEFVDRKLPSWLSLKRENISATQELLGTKPIRGELIELDEDLDIPSPLTARRHGKLDRFSLRTQRLIITNKRLIVRGSLFGLESFEIARKDLRLATITSTINVRYAQRLAIRLLNGKEYFIVLGDGTLSRVQKLIPGILRTEISFRRP